MPKNSGMRNTSITNKALILLRLIGFQPEVKPPLEFRYYMKSAVEFSCKRPLVNFQNKFKICFPAHGAPSGVRRRWRLPSSTTEKISWLHVVTKFQRWLYLWSNLLKYDYSCYKKSMDCKRGNVDAMHWRLRHSSDMINWELITLNHSVTIIRICIVHTKSFVQ